MFNTQSSMLVIFLQLLLIGLMNPAMGKSAISEAEKLVKRLPENTLGFAATSGADELEETFEKTTLGQIWNDAGVQTFYQSIKTELLNKLRQTEPNDANDFNAVMCFAKTALKRPIIVGAAQKQAKEGPPIYGFAILDAGTHKVEIASALTKLEGLADEGDIIEVKVNGIMMHGPKETDDVKAYWGWVGNYLLFAINDGEGLAIKSLSSQLSQPVPTCFEKVSGAGDALAVCVDFEKFAGFIKTIAAQEGGEDAAKKIATVMKELGLNNVKTFAVRTGFLGRDIVTNGLLEVPQPRTGLFANYKAINLSTFDLVDGRAVNTASSNWDIAGAYDTIMEAIKVVSPNDGYVEINKEISNFESEVNFRIRKGLLESLEGSIVFYALPAGVIMESPQGGTVVIAKLKDRALFEKTMSALGKYAANQSDGMLQISSQVQSDGTTLHTWVIAPLAMMQLIPCWAIVDKQVVIASNPALYNIAFKQMSSSGNSIRNTEGFRKTTAKLPDNLISLGYTNSKVQFNQLLMKLQQFWPMITMAATKAGVKLPFMLPSLSHILEGMEPSCGYCWFDSEGLRSQYQGTGIEQSFASVAGASMGAAILMPALGRTRQLAIRMASGANLSSIGKSCILYSVDHNGNYPDNLQELVEKTDLPPKCLISKYKPKASAEPSYIYIAGQNNTMHPGNVIAYDNPMFCHDGVNVLFNDAHVEWMKPEEFLKELEATYKRLGREMPGINFKDSVKHRFSSKSWSPEAKAWALGCAGVLNEVNHCRHNTLLPCDKNEKNIESWKKSLDKWWGVKSRNDLFGSLRRIEKDGHRKMFDDWGKYIQSLSEEQYKKLVEEKGSDKEKLNEILIAKEYHKKLGGKSLLGWDYSRYICLCRWGYLVGYISEEEAWERIMPVAEMLQKKFDSWEDLGRNYLIGRRFWSHKYTIEKGDLYEDAFQRLLDMRSSPWNKYPWDMDLTAVKIVNDPNKKIP